QGLSRPLCPFRPLGPFLLSHGPPRVRPRRSGDRGTGALVAAGGELAGGLGLPGGGRRLLHPPPRHPGTPGGERPPLRLASVVGDDPAGDASAGKSAPRRHPPPAPAVPHPGARAPALPGGAALGPRGGDRGAAPGQWLFGAVLAAPPAGPASPRGPLDDRGRGLADAPR